MANCDEKMFPEELVAGSVQTQEELNAAFAKWPTLSKAYVQTAVYWEKYRVWLEEYWPQVCRHLDKNFLEKFKTEAEHVSRAWEFHLAAVLIKNGIHLEEKTWDYGPDFCIKLPNGRNLWIEAIVCDRGEVDPVEPYPEMIPDVIHTFTFSIDEVNRPRALRITNAIATKFEKFKKYLADSENTGVSESDCLVAAVNGQLIQHHADPDLLFKRAIFGHGLYTYVKVPGKEEMQGPFYRPEPVIIKKVNGTESSIPASFMEMDEFSTISTVLYCGYPAHHSWNNEYEIGEDFMFAYHVNPKNPIPDGFFKFGRGIRKEVGQGTITDQTQA
jgi:hypothetical protein